MYNYNLYNLGMLSNITHQLYTVLLTKTESFLCTLTCQLKVNL